MTDDILGRRFTVTRPSAWFPRDFTVLRRSLPGILEVQSAVATYMVAEARFYLEMSSAFAEQPPPGEVAANELSAAEALAVVRRLRP